jgi:diaminohydroxyphosphoribosylaminopyrimidine deaminase/5-amino-6-(5-phosphoribosylamino)uracil reductase
MAAEFNPVDHSFMSRALVQARRGLYTTTPNPRVGCVIVRDGAIVGEGFHEKAGEPHAEVHALRAAGEKARGATLYVTLEPCSHHGRTAPCTDAVIAAGVVRVVAAMRDPNPKVAGQGFARLRAAGITVDDGVLEDEARELNIGFVSRMTRGTPWVRMKVAATLDGRTALANRKSQWITGEAARADGHAWRARACALLTGFGTVRDDDPQLNVRMVDTPRQPLRVLVDSRLETSPAAKILEGGNVLVFGARDDAVRRRGLEARGAEVIVLPNASGKVDLPPMLEELARRGMNEIHVESGTRLNGSLLAEGCVDELLIYLAPKLIGNTGLGMFDLPGMQELAAAQRLDFHGVLRIGEDLRIMARISPEKNGDGA